MGIRAEDNLCVYVPYEVFSLVLISDELKSRQLLYLVEDAPNFSPKAIENRFNITLFDIGKNVRELLTISLLTLIGEEGCEGEAFFYLFGRRVVLKSRLEFFPDDFHMIGEEQMGALAIELLESCILEGLSQILNVCQ